MSRYFLGAVAFALTLAATGPTLAQDSKETLADIRQQLTVLYVDLQNLKRELSTTGGVAGGGSAGTALQRLDTIEAELQHLTARAEELEFRIETVVNDGTNRVGDLEFRLCELEPDCDIGSLGDTPRLGGGSVPVATAPVVPTPTDGPELAIGEQAEFDAAVQALDAGDAETAADALTRFVETYPVGPLTTEAQFLRGSAYRQLGRTADSARGFLESFSSDPNGPRAPDALFMLGLSLNDLGQKQEACVTLAEVSVRFPDAPQVQDAAQTMSAIGCN